MTHRQHKENKAVLKEYNEIRLSHCQILGRLKYAKRELKKSEEIGSAYGVEHYEKLVDHYTNILSEETKKKVWELAFIRKEYIKTGKINPNQIEY